MDTGALLQGMLEIVFKGNMIYLAPFLLLLMALLFGDRLIDVIFDSLSARRGRY